MAKDKEIIDNCDLQHRLLASEIQERMDKQFAHQLSALSEKLDVFREEFQEATTDSALLEKSVSDLNKSLENFSTFMKELKGNGTPGIWERIRLIDKKIKVIITVGIILLVLQFGGNMYSLSKSNIDETVQHSVQGLGKALPQPEQSFQAQPDCNTEKETINKK